MLGAYETDTLLLEDCRQWLKQAQGYVIHLQRHLEALGAGTAGADAWRLAYRDAAETLGRVVEHISTGGVSVSGLCARHCGGSCMCCSTPAVSLTLCLHMVGCWYCLKHSSVLHLHKSLPHFEQGKYTGDTCWCWLHRLYTSSHHAKLCSLHHRMYQDEDTPEHTPLPKALRSKLVSTTSQLPYGSYWSKKIAI